MNLGIKNKRALITGAGRGLGKSIALNLTKEGVKVALVSRSSLHLKHAYQELGGAKNGHYMITADLTLEKKPEMIAKKIIKDFGTIDIVVNNLGDSLDIKDPFCKIADWRKLWRINMEVAIEINNVILPQMMKQKWGRIVHISSIAALENQGPVPYCSIKAALTAYNRSMGRVVASQGVIMTSVLPGAVFTEGGYWDITSKTKPDHVKKYLQERMAIKRFGKPDEIGAVVTFLCSEHASFCVGSTVPVDGGQGRVFF